jgi:hypothetical protein
VDCLPTEQLKNAREAVVAVARALAAASVPFLEGVRQLDDLRFAATAPELDLNPDFMIFVAIASEADHLPPEGLRNLCSPQWLEKCDAEARSFEEFYGADVREACVRLISRFSLERG